MEALLCLDFTTRGDTYSLMKYHWYNFSGTDYNQENRKQEIYKIIDHNEEKELCQYVDTSELCNYDYLMFANIDYSTLMFLTVRRTGVFGLLKDSRDSGRPFPSISSQLPLNTSLPGSTPYDTFLPNSLRYSLTI